MMKAEKNIPELRFPEFEGEWDISNLNSVANIYDGTHQTPKYVETGIRFVSVENIDNIENTTKYITEEAFIKDFKIKPRKNDILMTRITAGIIGATAIVQNDDPLAFYVSLALIRTKKGVDVGFLNQYINSFLFKHELHKRIIHVAFPKKINLGDIGGCRVTITSIPEQQKIATFLSSIDQRIQLLTRKKEQLEQYKKGVMQQIFSQQLRFKDEQGKEYPNWEEKRLGEIAVINPRIDKVPDNFQYIDLESVEKGNLKYTIHYNQTDAPSRAQRVLECGDILFQMVRPYQKNNYYFNLEGSFVASTGYAQIRYDRCPKFIYQIIHSENFVGKVINRCTGSSYPAINSTDLGDILMLFPKSIKEQQKIASFLSSIDDKITRVNTQIEQTRKWKQGLLQKMFV